MCDKHFVMAYKHNEVKSKSLIMALHKSRSVFNVSILTTVITVLEEMPGNPSWNE